MSLDPAGIRAALLDIEGTTTPIAFVFEVLFPYARKHLREHLERHANAADYPAVFDRLRAEYAADQSAGENPPLWIPAPSHEQLASVARYVDWLMDRDRKSTGLKELQGRIWEEGYHRGDLASNVFPDVARAFERWHAKQLRIAIFSSGSVRAQQLLFRHSASGDLTKFISHYFDTTTGAKSDPDSYRRISAAMAVPPQEVVFVSDVTRELDAARAAGMQTRLSVRPGNAPVAAGHGHLVVRTFDEVFDW